MGRVRVHHLCRLVAQVPDLPGDRCHPTTGCATEDGDELVDSFDLVVCSPSWLADQVAEGQGERFRSGGLRATPDSVIVGSGIWLMRRWARDAFDQALRVITDVASPGPDWGSVAARIGRFVPWEFNYRYDQHVNEHYGEPFPPFP